MTPPTYNSLYKYNIVIIYDIITNMMCVNKTFPTLQHIFNLIFFSTQSSVEPSSSKQMPLINQQQIEPQDICAAITSRSEYDFLTNKYLGVSKLKEIEENR